MLRYPARYEAAEEGGYVIEILALDIMTEGDMMEELLEMAEDALNGVLTV
jgi:predicted RNase H-like HicB family nuclease